MEKEIERHPEHLQLKADLEGAYLLESEYKPEKGLVIFYAPSGGSVHKIARLVKQKLSQYHPDIFSISEVKPDKFLDYRNHIWICSSLGRNTWEMEQKDAWSSFLPRLRRIRLDGRKIAIVGLGDHVSYPNHFVDSIAVLADVVDETGGILIGKTPTVDYVFNDSRALCDGLFMGLPIDEDYEKEKTGKRLDEWMARIKSEF